MKFSKNDPSLQKELTTFGGGCSVTGACKRFIPNDIFPVFPVKLFNDFAAGVSAISSFLLFTNESLLSLVDGFSLGVISVVINVGSKVSSFLVSALVSLITSVVSVPLTSDFIFAAKVCAAATALASCAVLCFSKISCRFFAIISSCFVI